jgi:hypothetical protein
MRKSTLSAWLEPNQARSLIAARTVGAVALLVVGGIHYQQYRYALYSVIPTIGLLFIVNFIAATVLGLALLAPFKEARTPRRTARPIRRIGRRRGRGERARRAADQRAHRSVRLHGARLPVRDRADDRIRSHRNCDVDAVPGSGALSRTLRAGHTPTRTPRRSDRPVSRDPSTTWAATTPFGPEIPLALADHGLTPRSASQSRTASGGSLRHCARADSRISSWGSRSYAALPGLRDRYRTTAVATDTAGFSIS